MILRFLRALAVSLVWAATLAAALAQDIDLNRQAVVVTDRGTFVLSFFADLVPLHVRLFMSRVDAGAYDGTAFGYVVRWGLIQGGSMPPGNPSRSTSSVPLSDVRAETSSQLHTRGTISLVLGSDDSDTGQFFICSSPQTGLDGRYTPFGRVAEGIEVIDSISYLDADPRGVPLQPPRILKVTLRPGRPDPPPAFADVPVDELEQYLATLTTSVGDITIEFLPRMAANHVRNFLRLAKAGFYDGTAFHRVVRGFVMQGGLLSTRLPPLPDFRIADLVRKLKPEFNDTRHVMGIVSMARYDDPDSAETSFFICLGDAPSLDGQYTVLGRVIEGMEVLERFQNLEVDGEAPRERVELKKVTLRKKPGAPAAEVQRNHPGLHPQESEYAGRRR